MTDEELAALRDEWLASEKARTEAFHALTQAHKNSPLGIAFAAAENKEKRAKETYSRALQNQTTKD